MTDSNEIDDAPECDEVKAERPLPFRLPDPKMTTLTRMRDAAEWEVRRIEGSQYARAAAGFISKPVKEQVLKRDDFEGMIRLIDRIMKDPVIMQRLQAGEAGA